MALTKKEFLVLVALVATTLAPRPLEAEGFFDKVKQTGRGAQFLWGERDPLQGHLGHIKGAFKDFVADGDLFHNFAGKIVQVTQNISSFKDNVNQFNFQGIKETVGNIDYLASRFKTILTKTVTLYKKYAPDIEYFSGVRSRLMDKIAAHPNPENLESKDIAGEAPAGGFFEPGSSAPVSYAAPVQSAAPQSAEGEIKNDIFKEERMDTLTGSVGFFNSVRYIFKKPTNIFKFQGIKSSYDQGKLGSKIGFRIAALLENVVVRVLSIKDRLKGLLDTRNLLNGFLDPLSRFSGNGIGDALNNLVSNFNPLKNGALAIIESIRRNVPIIKDLATDYKNKYGSPFEDLGDKIKSKIGGSKDGAKDKDDFVAKPLAPSREVVVPQNMSLKQAHDRYNRLFEEYRTLVMNPNSSSADKERLLAQVQEAKVIYTSLLRSGAGR